MGMLLRNGRLFLKKKNEASLLRDMVYQVKIVKQACRKEQAQHLQWSGRGLKVLFHATKIVFLTNSFISYADVAQLAEQLICNQQVIGSSPIIGFIQFNIELYYGQIPEWPKGTDCKSAATCFDGSNPSLPIKKPQVV